MALLTSQDVHHARQKRESVHASAPPSDALRPAATYRREVAGGRPTSHWFGRVSSTGERAGCHQTPTRGRLRVGARFAVVTVRYLLARLEGHYGLIVPADED